MTRTRLVCVAILSPMIVLAIGSLGLVAFWGLDTAAWSAGRNAGTMRTFLQSNSGKTVHLSDIAASVDLPVRSCLCVVGPYAFIGDRFVIGGNDLTDDFGSELSTDTGFAMISFEPVANGAVDRAVISRSVDIPLPATATTGLWCGRSDTLAQVSATGQNSATILTADEPTEPCTATTTP